MSAKSSNRIINVLLWVSLAMNALMVLVLANYLEKKGGISYLRKKIDHQLYSGNSYEGFYYIMKTGTFREMPSDSNSIIILGNSIADYCDWAELLADPSVKNRGIGGDDILGVFNRIAQITDLNPSIVILLLDHKDFCFKRPVDTVAFYYEQIISNIRQKCPGTKILCVSMIPANNMLADISGISGINDKIREISVKYNTEFTDVVPLLCTPESRLKSLYTSDGEHLNGNGYKLLAGVLTQFISDQKDPVPSE